MSADPEVPAAPRLRAIREAWLERAVERLEADPAISAAGFVGSLGRGDATTGVTSTSSSSSLTISSTITPTRHICPGRTWLPGASTPVTMHPAAPVRSVFATSSTAFPCTWTGTSTRAPRPPGSRTQRSSSTSRAFVVWTIRSASTRTSVKCSPRAQSRKRAPAAAGFAHPGGREVRRPAVGRRGTHGRVRRRTICPRGGTGRVPGDPSTAARPVPRRRTRRDAGPRQSLP